MYHNETINHEKFKTYTNQFPYLAFEQCQFENVKIPIEKIHDYEFTHCSGTIVILVNDFSHCCTIPHNSFKIQHEFVIQGQSFDKTNSYQIQQYFSQCLTKNYSISFHSCSFDDVEIKGGVPSITLEKCEGQLNLLGQKIQDKEEHNKNPNNFTVPSLTIKENYFKELKFNHLDIDETYILGNNKHHFMKFVLIPPIFCFCLYIIMYWPMEAVSTLFTLCFFHFFIFIGIPFLGSMFKLDENKFIRRKILLPFLKFMILKWSIFLFFYGYILFHYSSNIYDFLHIKNYISIKYEAHLRIMSIIALFVIYIMNRALTFYVVNTNHVYFSHCNMNKLTYDKSALSIFHLPIFFERRGIYLNLQNCLVKTTDFRNFEGEDNAEKIFYSLENNQINFNHFATFEELTQHKEIKNFDFLVKNKNYIHSIGHDKNSNIFLDIFHTILYIIYNLFYRLKNITLSLFLFYLLGISCFFSSNHMTIADTTVQVYLKDKDKNVQELSNKQIFFNIEGEKKTQIYAPDFYPEYSASYYTISLFMPFIDNEQTKLFRPNSSMIEYWVIFYRILGLLHFTAFMFIITNRFLFKKKE